jgi:hypothetical protein
VADNEKDNDSTAALHDIFAFFVEVLEGVGDEFAAYSDFIWKFLEANAVQLGALAAVVILAGVVLKYWRRAVTWVRVTWRKLRYNSYPRDTIRVVKHPDPSWWHMGSVSGEPAMQVVGTWYVTNITDTAVRVLAARLENPRRDGTVSLTQPISPGDTTRVATDFWVSPPVRSEGQEFRATVVLVDQYGNEHRVKNVVFRYN